MLICTLLTFELCADPDVPAAIAFGDMTVPIVWTREATASCMDLGRRASGGPGDAHMEFAMGRADIRITGARIQMTAYRWHKMTAADDVVLRRNYRATLWHEIGHIRVARASIATARANHTAPDAAFAQVNAEQNDYDDRTLHGIAQDHAPPPLAGADTIIDCP